MAHSHNPTIIIIGAGIIGLTIAIKLQETLKQRSQILLVSREWPGAIPGAPLQHSPDYASMWAGAHVRPIPATTPQLQREANWLKKTVREFDWLVEKEPSCGITRTAGVEYLEAPDEGYRQQDAASFARETGLPGYRQLQSSELPESVKLGFEYETFCVNSPLYCETLLRKFVLGGGRTVMKDLKSEWEAFTLVDNVTLVINASGTGFGDPKCFPTRGQTVVTDLVDVAKTVTRQNNDGTWSFLIPRFFNGGTIVGGTKEPNDWRTDPCAATREKLLDAGLQLEPLSHARGPSHQIKTLDDVKVIADVVGRRPTRQGGMRVEVEERTIVDQRRSSVKGTVLHAYGAGGRGYEISWGVASEVVELAMPLLSGEGTAKL